MKTRKTPAALTDATNLGTALLIAEFEDGNYRPVALVGSIGDGREIAASHMRNAAAAMERGAEIACPGGFAIWSTGFDGAYSRIAGIEA